MGADGIELDVQMTKDNQCVVIHDETIKRVSNGNAQVKDSTLEELREFDFGKGFTEYGKVQIPTLEEVLQLVVPSGLTLNIEPVSYTHLDVYKRQNLHCGCLEEEIAQ